MDFWNDNTTSITLKKWKICDSKKGQNSVKIKNKASSNEDFISEVHWNFLNIDFFNSKIFKWCDCCKFLSLKVQFTF